MLNLNKHTKTKPNAKPTLNFKNYSYVYAYHCVQLSYITQLRTVLTIFRLILQTITIAQMMSTAGEALEGTPKLVRNFFWKYTVKRAESRHVFVRFSSTKRHCSSTLGPVL